MKKSLIVGIADQRQATWYWQDKSGTARWPTRYLERRASVPYLHQLAKLWKHRKSVAVKLALRQARVIASSDMGAWMCIHSHEGSWTDSGAPYYGGLQMDYGFQSTYGSEYLARFGTADHWPVAVQIEVARRARDGYHGYGARGYGPWPNTARACGLL